MKVAFPFVGDAIGGSHVSAATLMLELKASGVEVIPIVHRRGSASRYFEGKGLKVYHTTAPFLDGPVKLSSLPRLLLCSVLQAIYLRREGFDLVHANDGRMIHNWVLAAKIARMPSVAHRRTFWVRSRISDRLHGLADSVIAISEYVAAGAPPYVRAKLKIIPNAFVIDSPNGYRSPELSDQAQKEKYVLFVGTHAKQKRPEVFLLVANAMLKVFPDLKFVMVGRETKYTPEIKREIEAMGLTESIDVKGFCSDMWAIYERASLLLAPAVREGHGRSLLEAMLVGVPVIASDSGGHAEIVEDGKNGFLAVPDDAEHMAEVALKVLRDQNIRELMVSNAKRSASQFSSPNVMRDEVLKVYQEIVQK